MNDEKKSRSSGKFSLKDLGVISPMDELREQMAALGRPSYLTDLQAHMAELTRPSYLADMQVQLAEVMRPSYLADMQVQLAEVMRPSYLADMQVQLAEVMRPSYLADMQAQLAEVTRPSYLADLQAQLAEVMRPSYLADMQVQLAEVMRPSYLTELQGQVATMTNGARMQAELAAVVGSYQDLINGSALASYLVTPNDADEVQVMRVEGFDSLEAGDFTVLEVDPVRSVDLEIVKAISEGEVAKLSPTAAQRLQSVYLQIVVYWDMLLRIFNTCMAVVYLTALMSNTTTPADIPKQAEQLSNYERQLLADYRIVNRNGARLRAEPSKTSEVIVTLKLGLPVEVLEKNGKGWFRVVAEYQDEWVEGWIHLTVTTSVPRPKQAHQMVARIDPLDNASQ